MGRNGLPGKQALVVKRKNNIFFSLGRNLSAYGDNSSLDGRLYRMHNHDPLCSLLVLCAGGLAALLRTGRCCFACALACFSATTTNPFCLALFCLRNSAISPRHCVYYLKSGLNNIR